MPYTASGGQPVYAQPIFNGQPAQPVLVVAPIHMSMTPNLQLPHAYVFLSLASLPSSSLVSHLLFMADWS